MSTLDRELWQLCPGLSGMADGRRRLLLMMEAYTDDSTEPPVFLLAGFVARAERWAEFTIEWRNALQKSPLLRYFKMKEAYALRGQFRGLSPADRDRRVNEFVGIIKNYALASVYSVVRQDDYSAVMRNAIAKPLDHPYWLMYHSIMGLIFEWEIRNDIKEPVTFIFDEQWDQSDQALSCYTAFYDQADPEIKSLFGARPVHLNDETTLPLQAADMLAWHLHRSYFEIERGVNFQSAAMDVLLSIETHKDVWTRARLERFISGVVASNEKSGKVTLHENRRMEESLPNATSVSNLRTMVGASANSSLILNPFLARGTGRFLLVHSCPRSSSPHLHRRSGDKCSLESPASGPVEEESASP